MKVIWLCRVWFDDLNALNGGLNYRQMSPWQAEFIKLFYDKKDVELFVITPNYADNSDSYFISRGIHFLLYKHYPDWIPEKLVTRYHFVTHYKFIQKRIEKLISKINPDIIHLHGSENPENSIGVVKLLKTTAAEKILLTVQGYFHLNPIPKGLFSKLNYKLRCKIERFINSHVLYSTLPNYYSFEDFVTFNKKSKNFVLPGITRNPGVSSDDIKDKKYDIVFFARICKEKGIEDIIKTISILNRKGKNYTLLVLGKVSENYLNYLKDLANRLNVFNQIYFRGFIPDQKDMFDQVVKAKITVLPSHFDGTPNTIREALWMRLPVVAYKIGGIPSFNEHDECITLANYLDTEDLAEKIELVFNDEERTKRLVQNGYNEIINYYSPSEIYKSLICFYFAMKN